MENENKIITFENLIDQLHKQTFEDGSDAEGCLRVVPKKIPHIVTICSNKKGGFKLPFLFLFFLIFLQFLT